MPAGHKHVISEIRNLKPRLVPLDDTEEGDVLTIVGGEPEWAPLAPGVPSGLIAMWGGQIADVPEGWSLCDGTNSTPDLTNKFIMGTAGDAGGTGGYEDAIVVAHGHTGTSSTESHNHTATTASDSHTHTATTASDSHSHTATTTSDSHNHTATTSSDNHRHTATTSSAGNHRHTINYSSDRSPDPGDRMVVDDKLTGVKYAINYAGSHTHSVTTAYDAHTHTLTTATDSHSHTLTTATDSHTHTMTVGTDSHTHAMTVEDDSHSHTVTVDSTGSSGTGRNLPPYYKLAYIQKD